MVLVLRKKSNPNVDSFMDEVHKSTSDHPFDNRARIYKNKATFELHKHDGHIHLSDIRTLQPKSGAGTEALKHLTGLADKHGVKISGVAKAYSNDKKHITDSKKLSGWYAKHGFKVGKGNKHDGYDIEYQGKKTVKEDAPTVSVASGGVAGLTGEPPVGNSATLIRRTKFAGSECFDVTDDVWHKARFGKRHKAHYKTFVGDDDTGMAIRDYGNKNPNAPIVLKNNRTGAMIYLRYGKRQ